MQNTVIYPGTFDPITRGHTDLIERAARLFGRVIVAIAANPGKSPCFTQQERVALAKEVLLPLANVEVIGFDCLLADFAKQQRVPVILRGLRAVSDFEYEFAMANMNKSLKDSIETMIVFTNPEYSFVASRMVKEVASHGGDLTKLVPKNVIQALKARIKKER